MEYLVKITAGRLGKVFLPAHALFLQCKVRVSTVSLRVRELLERDQDVLMRQLLDPPLLVHDVDQSTVTTELTIHSVSEKDHYEQGWW